MHFEAFYLFIYLFINTFLLIVYFHSCSKFQAEQATCSSPHPYLLPSVSVSLGEASVISLGPRPPPSWFTGLTNKVVTQYAYVLIWKLKILLNMPKLSVYSNYIQYCL